MNVSAENISGYAVNTQNAQTCVAEILVWVKNGRQSNKENCCRWLACINPHSYTVARHDSPFSQALSAADWLVPDGAGIVFASKILGGQIRERITGSDIFQKVLEELDKQNNGYSVFLLGSTEETLATIRARMKLDYPNIRVVGSYSPPFKPDYTQNELDDMITAINTAEPDILWVGMTAPKQEKWIYQNRARLKVKFAAAIGAVFDFYSGKVKRSHPIFQRSGLEWLPRLVQQPQRLWRRMFVSAPIFMLDVLRQWLSIRWR